MTNLPTEGSGGESARRQTCRWCRRPLDHPEVGRPRQFCKRSCRQRDFEARTKAAAHGLDEHELVIARTQLDQLRDDLYVLQCAVEDVERDLGTGLDERELREAIDWLLTAARPLRTALG